MHLCITARCGAQAKGEWWQGSTKKGEVAVSDIISTTRSGGRTSEMADSKDNLNWFLRHCTKFHYLLETDVTMYNVALMIMKHIIGMAILFVSNKVLDDLRRTISAFTKSKSKHLLLYTEPVANCLMQLIIADDKFSVGNLWHCMSPSWQLQEQQHLLFLGSNLEQQHHLLSLGSKILH